MTDFATWMHDVGYDGVFRILVKRRVGDWTPYEWDKKFSDESMYKSNHYIIAKIVEVIELPDKDILIGFKEIYDKECLKEDFYEDIPIHYKKLSEIDLSVFPCDMEEFYDCEIED